MRTEKSRLREAVRTVRNQIYSQVKLLLADESRTYGEIAKSAGVSVSVVQRVAQQEGVSRQVGPRAKRKLLPSDAADKEETVNGQREAPTRLDL